MILKIMMDLKKEYFKLKITNFVYRALQVAQSKVKNN